MTWEIIKGKREERAALIDEAKKLITTAAEESRGMSAEENERWKVITDKAGDYSHDIASCSGMGLDIRQLEQTQELDNSQAQITETIMRHEFHPNPKTAPNQPSWEEKRTAFEGFALRAHGKDKLLDRHMEAAEKTGMNLEADKFSIPLWRTAPKSIQEVADRHEEMMTRATTTAQTITTTGGGHLIANDNSMIANLEIALLAWGGLRQNGATIIRTASGGTMPIPSLDDTTNKSVVIAINTAADVEALVFGQQTWSAFMYTTKQVLVPYQLLQDSALDVPNLIMDVFGVRAGRGTHTDFTVGATDGNQPEGYVSKSLEGSTGSDVNTVTYSELVTLQHSVDPAYRVGPNVRWSFNDNTLSVIKKLVDGDSRPLWSQSVIAGDPDTILGVPYFINQDMGTIASATTGTGGIKAITFGDMSKYYIRDVVGDPLTAPGDGPTVQRLNERYAEKAQVGFIGHHRHDGKTVIGSTVQQPIKHFVTKST